MLRSYYRGVGEFHIYGDGAAAAMVKKVVDFAVERDLYLCLPIATSPRCSFCSPTMRTRRSSGSIPDSRQRRRGCGSFWKSIRR